MSVTYDKKLFSGFFKETREDKSTGITACYADAGDCSTFVLHLLSGKRRAYVGVLHLFSIVIDNLDAVVCEGSSISFYNDGKKKRPVLTVTLKPVITPQQSWGLNSCEQSQGLPGWLASL